MTIDNTNGFILNSTELNFHDDIFISLEFDYFNKDVILNFKKYPDYSGTRNIKFINVIFISMSACEFWGKSQNILDFEYISLSDRVLIPIIQNNMQEQLSAFSNTLDNYIEVLITLSSGDKLRVVCERIYI